MQWSDLHISRVKSNSLTGQKSKLRKNLKRTSNLSLNSETLVYASVNQTQEIITLSTNQHLLMMQLAIVCPHTNWSPFTTVWAWAKCTDSSYIHTVDSPGIEASDLMPRVGRDRLVAKSVGRIYFVPDAVSSDRQLSSWHSGWSPGHSNNTTSVDWYSTHCAIVGTGGFCKKYHS